MAILEQKVNADLNSQVVFELIRQVNNLLTAIDAAANFAGLQASLVSGGAYEAATVKQLPDGIPAPTIRFPQ